MTETVDEVIARLNKKFGDRIVGHLSDEPLEVEVIPTGSLALDIALGVGGIPKQRITELYGPEGSGKTTIMQHLVAECQKMGEMAVYIDMEHKLDPAYAARCGVDMDKLIFSQPPHGIAAFEIVNSMIPHAGVVVVDSVFDLVTPAEIDSQPGDTHMAKLARLMGQELKKIKPRLGFSNCALVFVNQVRTGMGPAGAYEVQPGGWALRFASSVRLRVRKVGDLPQKSGIRSLVQVKKNNVAPPLRETTIEIVYGMGIATEADILEAALQAGVVERRGTWYDFDGEHIANSSGKLPVIERLAEDKELADKIRGIVLDTASASRG